jgi:MoxR-like ATPase
VVNAEGSALFNLIAPNIEQWAVQFTGQLKGEMRSTFDQLVAEVKDIASMQPLRLAPLDGGELVFDEMVHGKFHRLLRACRTTVQGRRANSILVGPAGSGKTYGAEQIYRALIGIPSKEGGISNDAHYTEVSCNEDMTATQISGATVPNISDGLPVYTPSRAVEVYQLGGVIVFDEFDRLRAGAAVALNAAIAGSRWPLPNGDSAVRHPDTVIVCTANTFGHGGNRLYTAANKMDSATIDRFVGHQIEWGYDSTIEKMLCPNVELRELLQGARDRMNRANIQRIISPRALQMGFAAVEIHGLPVLQAFYEALADWNENDLRMIDLEPSDVFDAIENYEEQYTTEAVGGAV